MKVETPSSAGIFAVVAEPVAAGSAVGRGQLAVEQIVAIAEALHVPNQRVSEADAGLDAGGVAAQDREAGAALGDVVVDSDLVRAGQVERLVADGDVGGG